MDAWELEVALLQWAHASVMPGRGNVALAAGSMPPHSRLAASVCRQCRRVAAEQGWSCSVGLSRVVPSLRGSVGAAVFGGASGRGWAAACKDHVVVRGPKTFLYFLYVPLLYLQYLSQSQNTRNGRCGGQCCAVWSPQNC